MKNIFEVRLDRLPPAVMRKPVYENYQANLESMKSLFKASIDPERFGELPIFRSKTPVTNVPESAYRGISICGLDVAEVGCGAICTLQAVSENNQYEYSDMQKICNVMEKRGYYYPGRGLWWHWFDKMGCRRVTHWYDICTAVYSGNIVTVLIKLPEHSRGLFVNIVGIEKRGSGDYIHSADELIFLTSDEGELTLETLVKYMSTVPYVW